MSHKDFKQIEKIVSKIVNLNEISNLNIESFIDILKKEKNIGTSFRLVYPKGVGKMFLKKIDDKKTIKIYIKDYLKYVQIK